MDSRYSSYKIHTQNFSSFQYTRLCSPSSIVNEVIETVYLFIYFFIKIFCMRKAHKLCSNISIRLKSIIKHKSNFHSDITHRSIIKHTSNFHLNITPRSIKNNFPSKYFYTLKKAYKELSFRYYVQKHKKQATFHLDTVGTRCNE